VEAGALAQAFLEAAGLAPNSEITSLDAALSAYVDAARVQHPEFETDVTSFVAYAGARAQGHQVPPIAHAAELWLACACARQLPAAISVFNNEYAPIVRRVLLRRRAPEDVADEVQQMLRERLLVADAASGRRPKIADYRGLGPLRSWVATVAATTLATLRRGDRRRREDPPESKGGSWAGQLDPELDYLKQRYAGEVEAAIVAALADLDARQRTLLQLHLGQRMNIDALGLMYHVSRATAARWLVAARSALAEAARSRLAKALGLSPSEVDSLVALVHSRIDISIARRLSDAGADRES